MEVASDQRQPAPLAARNLSAVVAGCGYGVGVRITGRRVELVTEVTYQRARSGGGTETARLTVGRLGDGRAIMLTHQPG